MGSRLDVFKGNIVLITTKVRSKGTIFATGGYFIAYDEQFVYLAPEDGEITTAVAIDAIVDITIVTEEELRQEAEASNKKFGDMN